MRALGPANFAVEVGGGEAADASADDDEIVGLVDGDGDGVGPFFAVAEGVGGFEGAVVSAAHSGQGRRIVRGIFFGSEGGLRNAEGFDPASLRGNERASDGDAEAVEEIAAGDFAVHAEFDIAFLLIDRYPLDFFPQRLAAHRALNVMRTSAFSPGGRGKQSRQGNLRAETRDTGAISFWLGILIKCPVSQPPSKRLSGDFDENVRSAPSFARRNPRSHVHALPCLFRAVCGHLRNSARAASWC